MFEQLLKCSISGWLATKIGGKHMFGIGIFGTAVLTIMTPPAARLSPYGLVALRVFEGIFEVSNVAGMIITPVFKC